MNFVARSLDREKPSSQYALNFCMYSQSFSLIPACLRIALAVGLDWIVNGTLKARLAADRKLNPLQDNSIECFSVRKLQANITRHINGI
jgi:hypothetical protein